MVMGSLSLIALETIQHLCMGPKTQCNDSTEAANPVLPPVPFLNGKKIRAYYNPTALAFLGDSIWEVRISQISSQAAFSGPFSTMHAKVSFL